MQAGARGAGLLSNPNKPSSDWLKMEVGTLERGWGIVLTPPLPVLAGSSHTPQRTQTWRTASPGWLCLRTSTSLSLPKVSLCFWICRRADIIAAVSFYILLFKFLYCIWGLKRWAWFLIKPISKWRAFWVLVASSLRKIFSTWPNPGSSRAFGNNVPRFIHLEEYAWSVWLVTQGSTVYSDIRSLTAMYFFPDENIVETMNHNTISTAFTYEANWTWTAHTFPDTPGAVVSSPSGSSVEASWEIHVTSLLFTFYWI